MYEWGTEWLGNWKGQPRLCPNRAPCCFLEMLSVLPFSLAGFTSSRLPLGSQDTFHSSQGSSCLAHTQREKNKSWSFRLMDPSWPNHRAQATDLCCPALARSGENRSHWQEEKQGISWGQSGHGTAGLEGPVPIKPHRCTVREVVKNPLCPTRVFSVDANEGKTNRYWN